MKILLMHNPFYHNDSQLERMRQELVALDAVVTVMHSVYLPLSGLPCEIAKGEHSACLFLDKDIALARALENGGIRLFNRSRAIELCDDKALTHLALDVAMPKTFAARLSYGKGIAEDYPRLADMLGTPFIAKERVGSLGSGVHLINSEAELLSLAKTSSSLIYQEFIAESAGSDIRVIVIGGRAIGAIKRRGEGFKAGISSGGSGEAYPLTDEVKTLAERSAAQLGLDYCGVDILPSSRGLLLNEVNSNAFFEEFERVSGINVAALYARHIIDSMN